MDKIKKMFVLVLENRSFDHMLGFSEIEGIDAKTGQRRLINGIPHKGFYNYEDPMGHKGLVQAASPADFKLVTKEDKDTGHEFDNNLAQLCGPSAQYPDPQTHEYPNIDMSGFVWDYLHKQKATATRSRKVMDCFTPSQLPVLTTLAREYAVCDAWFSSMPGPTFPNRFFFHAGSSAGLDHSPHWGTIINRMKTTNGWSFEHGTVFDWLNQLDSNKPMWRIYEGDRYPHSGTIKGINKHLDKFYPYSKQGFVEDLKKDDFESVKYIFIEPNYGRYIRSPGDFSGGTSQHPLDDVRSGEQLIKEVYEAIRDSKYWESSLLLITYDEHGGFVDHVPPPKATPPGDEPEPDSNDWQFNFTRYGARVPAVVVSPWVPKGVIDDTEYDHSSLPKTLVDIFSELGKGRTFTNRINCANSFHKLCSLQSARKDKPVIPDPPFDKRAAESGEKIFSNGADGDDTSDEFYNTAISPEVAGFLYAAYLRGKELVERNLMSFVPLQNLAETETMGQARASLERISAAMNDYYRGRASH